MKTANLHDPELESRICTQCGICCNGAIFSAVSVQNQEEANKLCGTRLALKQNEDVTMFDQPCPEFQNSMCQIYKIRPTPCRNYRCQILRKLEKRTISIAEATKIITTAKKHISELYNSLEVHNPTFHSRSLDSIWKKINSLASASENQEFRKKNARIFLNLFALRNFIHQNFYRAENKAMLITKNNDS